jgi:hypothetical protein
LEVLLQLLLLVEVTWAVLQHLLLLLRLVCGAHPAVQEPSMTVSSWTAKSCKHMYIASAGLLWWSAMHVGS